MRNWIAELRTSFMAVLALAVILCGLYPLTVWVLAHGLFPGEADGSLITHDGAVLGSSLIGQGFSSPRCFHPRPSAAGQGYDAAQSSGSNLGPLSKNLVDQVARRVAAYRAENGLPAGTPVPADAVTASGSGLDPHISVKNALLQVPRVARARGLAEADVRKKVETCTEGRTLGILGEPRVNVLRLNLALDGIRDAGR
ncbi:MAG TPA: K(+)-transporting ATPase subunit C [Acidobacteriota bacterium]|nr:K(+)-transporting ATPase subunit C [Acidobacteriota bacterium]